MTHHLFQFQFFSDTGGAAGLILGLNVLVLVQFVCKWTDWFFNSCCIKLRRHFYETEIEEIQNNSVRVNIDQHLFYLPNTDFNSKYSKE